MRPDLIMPVVFAVIGSILLLLAVPINAAMIRMAEWQLDMMRRPWGVWYYRFFGFFFLVGAIAVFFSPAQH